MNAKLIKVIHQKDKSGNPVMILCFKGEDGRSYRTWTGKQFGNYIRWFSAIAQWTPDTKKEIWLNGLILKAGNLIDADSRFTLKVTDSVPAANAEVSSV